MNGLFVHILPAEQLPEAAAEHIANVLERGIYERDSCSIAFSGGGTPNPMFEALAQRPVDWPSVELFQADERLVPAGHPDHNFTALDSHLISKVPLSPDRVHPMETEASDPAAAAARYERTLARRAPHGLGMVHLGLGDDGHTASWPPGDTTVLDSPKLVEVVGPYRDYLRMTLTPRAIRNTGSILWMVAGSGKAPALKQLVDADPRIPAWHARVEGSTILADEAAGRLLQ
ncbi:MAG: 6-phosphogluconolactonase [Actinomycetota bacterium]